MAFGLQFQLGMLLVVLIGFLTGFGLAAFGVTIAAVAKTIDNVKLRHQCRAHPDVPGRRHVLPVSALPSSLRTVAKFNPLYHCVAIVRDVSLNTIGSGDPVHAAVLIGFALVMWRVAIWQLEKRLIN